MFPRLVNLTFLHISREIDHILTDYPEYPYQIAFNLPVLRQKLIAHVLNNVPNHYIVIEDISKPIQEYDPLYYPLAGRLKIENVIRGGILYILQENSDWFKTQLHEQNLFDLAQ